MCKFILLSKNFLIFSLICSFLSFDDIYVLSNLDDQLFIAVQSLKKKKTLILNSNQINLTKLSIYEFKCSFETFINNLIFFLILNFCL
jgi:hypothetical protein